MDNNSNSLEHFINEAQYKYDTNPIFKRSADYYSALISNKIDDKTIMYEAFYGRAVTCNPGALFRYLLNDPRFKDFTHIWVIEESEFRDSIIEEYKDYPNVIFTDYLTEEYFKYLSTAKYLINNSTWHTSFTKKEGQVLINTWHGIPLKHLGYDIPNGRINVANIVRNYIMTDYIISPVKFTTENFRDANRLDGIFEGKIIETGYPRIDMTLNADKEKAQKELKSFGVNYDPNKKLILYAPTWKGMQFNNPHTSTYEYDQFIEVMNKHIDTEKYQVLFKPHQIMYKTLKEHGMLKDYYIPAVVDTNRLLGITDVLISDYSSIFFDFLTTDRPLYFYVPDLEGYKASRGLYFPAEDLPGPATSSLEELAEWCSNFDNYKNQFDYTKYTKAKEKFVSNDDGNVCERVVNTVFFGDESNTISLKNNKKKILFHTDKILANGISMSMLNLLNALDCEKYDVTFYAIGTNNDATLNYIDRIQKNIRVLYRNSEANIDIETYAKRAYCDKNGIADSDNELYPAEFYRYEFKRCFGDVKFDYIIDFSGFNSFWANVYLNSPCGKKFIWMHSVMQSEYNRKAKGKEVFKSHLDVIYQLYEKYDKIVSCSKITMEYNRRDLATESTYDKFKYVFNMIDYNRVYDCLENYTDASIDNESYFVENITHGLSSAMTELSLIKKPDKDFINFVTVGRLSNEKNHENLILAFKRINKENKNTKLYLVGNGPNLETTRSLIKKHKLTDCVILTGNMTNPFAFMKECHCFLLPSFYEGQPMVLLEARMLGLPIIVSNFATISDSVFPDGQLVIEMGEDDIYNGLKAFIDGKVPNNYKFDPVKYNEKCLAEFESLLD
ncbi:MAG: CDP-glycerol glycerophosphotransferase family protein [Acetobacter sp.]|nr:CDP-glycerol glycerophosphotransferase family protein [Bacteroides sp.]MCM1341704.1 CDP-glycerol glycerophosphotransferase family protein [Acetobacter sp.]MCM1432357.1 CDP-glycerol glycerophosphotransferase family protein [Clostridiales bacterium]